MLCIDAYGCDTKACDSVETCYAFLDKLVVQLGMDKQAPPFVFRTDGEEYPDKAGISAWVAIVQSGIQLHTLSRVGFVSVDIYTCGDLVIGEAMDLIRFVFGPTKIEERFLVRGLHY